MAIAPASKRKKGRATHGPCFDPVLACSAGRVNPAAKRIACIRTASDSEGLNPACENGKAPPLAAYIGWPAALYQQRRTLRQPRQSQTRRQRHGTSVTIEVAAAAFAIGVPLAGAAEAPGSNIRPKPTTARMTKVALRSCAIPNCVVFMGDSI